jgi:two-component system, OmpR family, copper resistance phosphate regulon response regulator CusR
MMIAETSWMRPKPALALIGRNAHRGDPSALLSLDFDVRVLGSAGEANLPGAYDADAVLLLTGTASFRSDVARIRAQSAIPLVVVLDDADAERAVSVLEAGADDVLAQPYHEPELLARLRAVMRRVTRPATSVLHFGDLEIDLERRDVRRGGRHVALSRTEFDLLRALARRSGTVVPRDVLTSEVWGSSEAASTATLHTFISMLRAKVDDGTSPPLVRTVRGIGYALDPAV